ncbi:hypothetical protein M8C21_002794 [Ambrosia artemisiifolia]|uniref:Uncharacterized protein n=1 Tax=Ambrosia artemisiifolia TaxID=4212 RepID=A0AAD5CFP8_AMBAR|nr:hypothetical protein M8C21_002794 [Ambrosia artemisiifolia]
MAQIVSISHSISSSKTLPINISRHQQQITHTWTSLQRHLQSNGKVYCLFSNNRSKDQAKKALESALGGKKTEFEKWDKEIKKRQEAGGGGDGGGGWWRRWFGGSDGEHFWHEAQQVGLTLLVLVIAFLVLAKGDVLFAVLLNPLLFALRSPRNGFRYIVSPSASTSDDVPKQESYACTSAKESVASKWA